MAKKMYSFRLEEETTGSRIERLSDELGISRADVIDRATSFFDAEGTEPWEMSDTRMHRMESAIENLLNVMKSDPTYDEMRAALDRVEREFEK